MSDYRYQRLTALDASFLAVETRTTPMHVGAVQIFDTAGLEGEGGGVDVGRIREYVAGRLHRIPRYRQRLRRTPLLGAPVWVDDPSFNVFYHVRHMALPPPGDDAKLAEIGGRIMSQQLDVGKPLWEVWIIEGLKGGRFAMLNKTHHCMIDGVSGADLIATLLTPEPHDAVEPAEPWIPAPTPGAVELAVDDLADRFRVPVEIAQGLRRALSGAPEARERLEAVWHILRNATGNASPTPFNEAVGPYRRWAWVPMELSVIRRIRHAFGGSVNDVVLATVAGAVRRFLSQRRGIDVDRLDFRVLAPVSTRQPEEHGTLGNRVSAWIVPLPVDEPDARRRFQRVNATTRDFKEHHEAEGIAALEAVAEWTGTTPMALAARLSSFARPFNMVVTNVPGPPVPLYLLKARMVAAHPLVPLFGNVGLGIALFSYAGTLSWGIVGDWDQVPDLEHFADDVRTAFNELVDVADEVAASSAA